MVLRAAVKIQVRYHLSIRLNLKKASENFEIADGGSVGDMVNLLVSRYGENFGDPAQYVFSIGGQPVETAHSLRDGDVLSIYPPMVGG